VYGRANPLVSLFAAERLAKRCGAPLILHFSDPIPCPWEDLRANGTRRLVLSVSKLLRSAALLTFTTPEAMAYAEGIYGCGIPARSVLVPNITPAWDDGRGLGGSAGRRELVYVGSFGGARQPDTLLEGLAVHNQMHPGESLGLALVGTQRAYAARATAVLRGRADVRWVPWTEEVMPHYAGARIAAVVDADDAQPVFLASKTLEAIHAARRVLIVSPDGSPARRLFDHRFRSVVFAHHRPEEVASQIRRLDALLDGEAHAEQRARREALTDFRGPQVASALVAALRQVGI